jgi:hypothetical protein
LALQLHGAECETTEWGKVMRMLVRPAKREGTSRTIFDRPLIDGDVKPGTDGPMITIEAEGIYSDNSKYRYLMEFTFAELEALIESSDPADPALGAGSPIITGQAEHNQMNE